jgi:hypothetical protein
MNDAMKNTNTVLLDGVPHKKTAGSVVKTILLFPFRLAWTAIKFGFFAVVAIFLALTIYCVSQFGKPMTIPETQGMTYNEFVANRYDAFMKYDKAYCERMYKECDWLREHSTTLTRFGGLPVTNMLTAPESVWAVFFPDGKVDRWLKNTDSMYSYQLPKGEVKWTNVLGLYWEAIQRSTYDGLVYRVSRIPFVVNQ